MDCILSKNIILECKDQVGGIQEVFIAERSLRALTIPVNGADDINGKILDGQPTSFFYHYQFAKNTSEYKQTIQKSIEAGTTFWQTELTLQLLKRENLKRNELKLLAYQTCIIVIKDRNGLYWLMGENNGAEIISGGDNSGKAMGDANGYDLVFQSQENSPMRQIDYEWLINPLGFFTEVKPIA